MRKIIINILEKLHIKIFHHPMSGEMKIFIKNLSWSFLAGMTAIPLIAITTLAGRFMGPTEYGKYSLLLIINQYITLFIFFGLDITSTKYIAKAQSDAEKKVIISTIFNFILVLLSSVFLMALLSYPILSHFSPHYSLFMILTIYYTVVVTIKTILDLFIRGIEKFKIQTIGKIIEATTIAAIFILLFLFFKKNNFISFLFVINTGAIAIAIYYFVYLFKYFGKGNREILKNQLSESKNYFISGLLGTLFITADRLIIGKYLGVEALGIYSAYYLASFTVISQINLLFANVFFPVTARLKDKSFANKIDRLLSIGFLPLLLILGGIMYVMLIIFGKEYPMNYLYILEFSIISSLYFFQALYNTVIVDVEKKRYARYVWIRNYVNMGTIVIYGVLVYWQIISILFILIALIINYIGVIIIQRLFIRSMQQNQLQ